MTKQEAVKIIDTALGSLNGTRAQHKLLLDALTLLSAEAPPVVKAVGPEDVPASPVIRRRGRGAEASQ